MTRTRTHTLQLAHDGPFGFDLSEEEIVDFPAYLSLTQVARKWAMGVIDFAHPLVDDDTRVTVCVGYHRVTFQYAGHGSGLEVAQRTELDRLIARYQHYSRKGSDRKASAELLKAVCLEAGTNGLYVYEMGSGVPWKEDEEWYLFEVRHTGTSDQIGRGVTRVDALWGAMNAVKRPRAYSQCDEETE